MDNNPTKIGLTFGQIPWKIVSTMNCVHCYYWLWDGIEVTQNKQIQKKRSAKRFAKTEKQKTKNGSPVRNRRERTPRPWHSSHLPSASLCHGTGWRDALLTTLTPWQRLHCLPQYTQTEKTRGVCSRTFQHSEISLRNYYNVLSLERQANLNF